MWWRALVALLALGLGSVVLLPEPSADFADVDERAVVIAALPCQPSVQNTSSGFVIENGLVVTVAHAIYESRDFALRDSAGRWHRPEILHMDLDRDIVVLRVPGLIAPPMATSRPAPDDLVRMVEGAASGTNSGAVLRRVRLTTESIGDMERTTERSGYELSVSIKGGDSGAAIVDSHDNLVGIVFARSTRREASWATSSSEILDALSGREVPSWQCANPSDVELLLEIPTLGREPRELAGSAVVTSPA